MPASKLLPTPYVSWVWCFPPAQAKPAAHPAFPESSVPLPRFPAVWSGDCPGPRTDRHSVLHVPTSARYAVFPTWVGHQLFQPFLPAPPPVQLVSTAGWGAQLDGEHFDAARPAGTTPTLA